jgi:hypothetical protein
MTNKELTASLDRLTGIVERMTQPIAPIPAIPAIPAIPPIAPIVSNNSEDHNLLLGVVGKLETVNVKIDVLSNDISELKKDKEIFVSQTQHTEVVERVKKLEDISVALVSFKDTLTGKMVVVTAVSGFLVGIMMLIIQHYFNLAK